MKLENQVTNLELAKKLKELGVEQESLFYWKQEAIHYWQKLDTKDLAAPSCYSAFTVAELGEILPYWCFSTKQEKGGYSCMADYPKWNCGWQNADTEADARAKMLIYLLENKLMGKDIK